MATFVLVLSLLLEPRLDHPVLSPRSIQQRRTRPCSLSQSSSRTPPLRSIVLTNTRALLPALRPMSQILSPGVTFRGCRSRSAAGHAGGRITTARDVRRAERVEADGFDQLGPSFAVAGCWGVVLGGRETAGDLMAVSMRNGRPIRPQGRRCFHPATWVDVMPLDLVAAVSERDAVRTCVSCSRPVAEKRVISRHPLWVLVGQAVMSPTSPGAPRRAELSACCQSHAWRPWRRCSVGAAL